MAGFFDKLSKGAGNLEKKFLGPTYNYAKQIKTPKEIHYKLSNFLHHLEYEHSGLKESDLETIIKEKRIYYDHEVDKSVKKWKSAVKLKKVDVKELPDYIKNNQHKLAKWFD